MKAASQSILPMFRAMCWDGTKCGQSREPEAADCRTGAVKFTEYVGDFIFL